LLLGNYFADLRNGAVAETGLYRWIASGNFAIVTIFGLALPIAAWFMRREALWLTLPASVTLAVGGALAVYFILRHRPLRAVTAIALLMTLGMISASLWIFPYVEQFKSRRSFSLEINKLVPSNTSVYIYADTMNDFNFYLGRAVMPVLATSADVEKLLSGSQTSYILIKDRDLKNLKMIAPGQIVLINGAGSTTWNLIEFRARPAS